MPFSDPITDVSATLTGPVSVTGPVDVSGSTGVGVSGTVSALNIDNAAVLDTRAGALTTGSNVATTWIDVSAYTSFILHCGNSQISNSLVPITYTMQWANAATFPAYTVSKTVLAGNSSFSDGSGVTQPWGRLSIRGPMLGRYMKVTATNESGAAVTINYSFTLVGTYRNFADFTVEGFQPGPGYTDSGGGTDSLLLNVQNASVGTGVTRQWPVQGWTGLCQIRASLGSGSNSATQTLTVRYCTVAGAVQFAFLSASKTGAQGVVELYLPSYPVFVQPVPPAAASDSWYIDVVKLDR